MCLTAQGRIQRSDACLRKSNWEMIYVKLSSLNKTIIFRNCFVSFSFKSHLDMWSLKCVLENQIPLRMPRAKWRSSKINQVLINWWKWPHVVGILGGNGTLILGMTPYFWGWCPFRLVNAGPITVIVCRCPKSCPNLIVASDASLDWDTRLLMDFNEFWNKLYGIYWYGRSLDTKFWLDKKKNFSPTTNEVTGN